MKPLHPIAHIENAFQTKFGIPRQSGLVSSFPSKIIFEPEYRNPDAFRGLDAYSPMQSEKRGHQRFDRLGWAEIREWAFLQLVRHFAPIPSGFLW